MISITRGGKQLTHVACVHRRRRYASKMWNITIMAVARNAVAFYCWQIHRHRAVGETLLLIRPILVDSRRISQRYSQLFAFSIGCSTGGPTCHDRNAFSSAGVRDAEIRGGEEAGFCAQTKYFSNVQGEQLKCHLYGRRVGHGAR